MGDRFTLDVDPDQVAGVARRWERRAEHWARRGRRTSHAPDRWAGGWSSKTSDLVAKEASTLGGHLTSFGRHFDTAANVLRRFADDLEQAVEVEVPDLNRRWRAADAAYDDAVAGARTRHQRALADLPPDTTPQAARMIRLELDDVRDAGVSSASSARSSAQHKLELEFDDVRDRLRRHARRVGQALEQSVAVPVPPSLVRAYRASQGNVVGRVLWGIAGETISDLATRAERELGGPLERLQRRLQNPPDDYDDIKALLARARDLGLPPKQYRDVLEQYWRHRAAEVAGIDLADWDPTKGADHNRATIEAVYRYYAQLYLHDPDLQWAGMANMIGPSFAAGFFDLAQFRRIGEAAGDLPDELRGALPDGIEKLGDLTAADLRFFETTFLDMQRQIFFDQGSMHQAYVDGGMAAVEEMEAAGLITPDLLRGWRDIDSGVPERVRAGNELFLLREQRVIIDDDYRKMYSHSPTGPAMTWAMTLIGAPSIPGAKGYPDVFPLTVTFDTPGPRRLGTPDRVFGVDVPDISVDNPTQVRVDVKTPFPDGNIATFDDRWALIEEDTLPRFQELLANDPDRARDIIGSDVHDRIKDYRMIRRVDDIVGQMMDWDVDVDQ